MLKTQHNIKNTMPQCYVLILKVPIMILSFGFGGIRVDGYSGILKVSLLDIIEGLELESFGSCFGFGEEEDDRQHQ